MKAEDQDGATTDEPVTLRGGPCAGRMIQVPKGLWSLHLQYTSGKREGVMLPEVKTAVYNRDPKNPQEFNWSEIHES